MIFHETPLAGCVVVERQPHGDDRGYFVRTFCEQEFAAHGLPMKIAQTSLSFSAQKATLRGLHFQAAPLLEDKLVSCLKGTIFDVMVDLRPGSPTFGRWFGTELSESNNRLLWSAKGFAHGFQTLSEDCLVAYSIGEFYAAEKSAGVRWDDADIAVAWPLPPSNQSPRDLALPALKDLDLAQLVGSGGT